MFMLPKSILHSNRQYMKALNLERFIPSRLKVHLIAIQINVVSRIFLKSRSYLSPLDFFAGGGRDSSRYSPISRRRVPRG
jgi:hypothetical protein